MHTAVTLNKKSGLRYRDLRSRAEPRQDRREQPIKSREKRQSPRRSLIHSGGGKEKNASYFHYAYVLRFPQSPTYVANRDLKATDAHAPTVDEFHEQMTVRACYAQHVSKHLESVRT